MDIENRIDPVATLTLCPLENARMGWALAWIMGIDVNIDFTHILDQNLLVNEHRYAVMLSNHRMKMGLMGRQKPLQLREDIETDNAVFPRNFLRSVVVDLLQTKNIARLVCRDKFKKRLFDMASPDVESD
jgi:hypothetical protein